MDNEKIENDLSFGVKCLDCSQSFNLFFDRLKQREEVYCPNCGQKLPEKQLNEMKHLLLHMNELVNNQLKCYRTDKVKGFAYSINWFDKKPKEYQDLLIPNSL